MAAGGETGSKVMKEPMPEFEFPVEGVLGFDGKLLKAIKGSSNNKAEQDMKVVQSVESSGSFIMFEDSVKRDSSAQTVSDRVNMSLSSLGKREHSIENAGTHYKKDSNVARKTRVCHKSYQSQGFCQCDECPINSGEDADKSDSSCDEEYPQKDLCLHRHEVQYHLTLHIQMKLCEKSLWDWIVERNTKFQESGNSNPYDFVDVRITTRILYQILEGVRYIHSMGVLHRDLKVFFICLHLRIGDFGLACRDIIQQSRLKKDGSSGRTHTTGVGSCLYAAPEQLKGSHYDLKIVQDLQKKVLYLEEENEAKEAFAEITRTIFRN